MYRSHTRPSCFTVEEWALWRGADRYVSGVTHGDYCRDCTQEYQTAMKAACQCDHPSVTFEVKGIDGVVGVHNRKATKGQLSLLEDEITIIT